VLTIARSASLQLLWGLINVLQLITSLPLLNIEFPANAANFYGVLSNLANFNLIPTGTINSYVFSFVNSAEPNLAFQTQGFGSSNIIDNLGSMFYYMIFFFVLAGFTKLVGLIKHKHK
jgi:hypothetical protein